MSKVSVAAFAALNLHCRPSLTSMSGASACIFSAAACLRGGSPHAPKLVCEYRFYPLSFFRARFPIRTRRKVSGIRVWRTKVKGKIISWQMLATPYLGLRCWCHAVVSFGDIPTFQASLANLNFVS